jgi:hypothetical protein
MRKVKKLLQKVGLSRTPSPTTSTARGPPNPPTTPPVARPVVSPSTQQTPAASDSPPPTNANPLPGSQINQTNQAPTTSTSEVPTAPAATSAASSSPSPSPGYRSGPPTNANPSAAQIGRSTPLPAAASPVASPLTLPFQQAPASTLASGNPKANPLPGSQINQTHQAPTATTCEVPTTPAAPTMTVTSAASSSTPPSPGQRPADPHTSTYSSNTQIGQSHAHPVATPLSSSSTPFSQQHAAAVKSASGTPLPTNVNPFPRAQTHQAPTTSTPEDRKNSALNILSRILKIANAATVAFPPAQAVVGAVDNVVDLFKVISHRRVFSLL